MARFFWWSAGVVFGVWLLVKAIIAATRALVSTVRQYVESFWSSFQEQLFDMAVVSSVSVAIIAILLSTKPVLFAYRRKWPTKPSKEQRRACSSQSRDHAANFAPRHGQRTAYRQLPLPLPSTTVSSHQPPAYEMLGRSTRNESKPSQCKGDARPLVGPRVRKPPPANGRRAPGADRTRFPDPGADALLARPPRAAPPAAVSPQFHADIVSGLAFHPRKAPVARVRPASAAENGRLSGPGADAVLTPSSGLACRAVDQLPATRDAQKANTADSQMLRTVITVVAEQHAPIHRQTRGLSSTVHSARFTDARNVMVGDNNRLDLTSRYRVTDVRVDASDIWSALGKNARQALSDLVDNPNDARKNAAFRSALPRCSEPDSINQRNSEFKVEARSDVEMTTIRCGLVMIGDHNRTSVRLDHTARIAHLDMASILKDDARLVTQLAGYLRDPREKSSFESQLTRSVTSSHLARVMASAQFDSNPPRIHGFGRELRADSAPVAMIGQRNNFKRSQSIAARRIASTGLGDLFDNNMRASKEAERQMINPSAIDRQTRSSPSSMDGRGF